MRSLKVATIIYIALLLGWIINIPSQAQSALSLLLSHQNCPNSCWMGIYPGLTEVSMLDILDIANIQYEKSSLGLEGTTFSYTVLDGYTSPIINNPDAIVIFVNEGKVGGISIQLKNITINDVVNSFGNPNRISDPIGSTYEFSYLMFGLIFSIDHNNTNLVERVIIVGQEGVALSIYGNSQVAIDKQMVPCNEPNQLCALATATPTPIPPTATPSPTPIACTHNVLASSTSAQYNRFQYPVWHPTQNIIALTNGIDLRFYSSDFSQLIKEFELVNNVEPVVVDIEWNPNGSMIAIALQGDDFKNQLQIWNYETEQIVNTFFDFGINSNIAWSNDSTSIFFIHNRNLGDDTIRQYDVTTGMLIKELLPPLELMITSISLSPNNTQIALSIVGIMGGLYFIDLQTDDFVDSGIKLWSDNIETPNFIYTSNGENLIGIEPDMYDSPSVLNTVTNEVIGTLRGHGRDITDIDWVNNQIVTTAYDDTVRFWDETTFEQIRVLQTGATRKLSFSPDGNFFVADTYDIQTIVVRESLTGDIVASLDPILLPTRTPYPTYTLFHF